MSGASRALLESFLDESLPAAEMALLEQALRSDPALLAELAAASARRDAGVHSLAAIWRRHRLSCPLREEWGSYLLGALVDEVEAHYRFHLEVIGCRYCQANVADLKAQQAGSIAAAERRRRRYFQSSAGHLRSATPGAGPQTRR